MKINIERNRNRLLVVGPWAICPTLLRMIARLAKAGPVRVVEARLPEGMQCKIGLIARLVADPVQPRLLLSQSSDFIHCERRDTHSQQRRLHRQGVRECDRRLVGRLLEAALSDDQPESGRWLGNLFLAHEKRRVFRDMKTMLVLEKPE